MSILAGCLGVASPLLAAPVTAPQTITASDPETVWNSDSPITISNNNGILVDGGKLTLNNVAVDINGTRNAGYGLAASNSGEMHINGGTFEHVNASSVSPALRVTTGGKMYVDGLTLNSSSRYGTEITFLAELGKVGQTPGGYLNVKNSEFTTKSGYMLNVTYGSEAHLEDTKLNVSSVGKTQFITYSIQILGTGNTFTGNNLEIKSDVLSPGAGYLFLINDGNDFQLTNSTVTSTKGQVLFSASGAPVLDNVELNYTSNAADQSEGLYAIWASGNGTAFNLKNSTLNVYGDKTIVGALVNGNGTFIADNSVLNIKDNAQAIQLNNGFAELNNSQVFVERAAVAAVRGVNDTKLTMTNSQIEAEGWAVDMTQGNMIVDASGSSTLLHGKVGAILASARTGDSTMTVNLLDGAAVEGDVLTRQTGSFVSTLQMNLTNGANWTGNGLNVDADGASTGVVNVSVDNASWSMPGSSNIDALVLNSGTVSLFNPAVSAFSTFTPNVLTVNDLSGTGTFVLRTDIVGDGAGNNQGDLLRVTGTSAGSHVLNVLNNGSAQTNGTEVLTVVETSDGAAQFAMANKVELGGYLYDVRQNGNDWELYGAPKPVTPPNPGNPDPGTPNPGPEITTTADAGANFLNIGYLMNYAENQTLLQRMGDLRQNGERGDMWLRGFAGKFDSFSSGKLSSFDMSYSGMQIGADKRVSADMPLFIGAFLGQTHASPDYRSGDGTAKSSNAGIYGTYMADSGFYLDAVAKYSRVKNSFNVKDSQNATVDGSGSSSGLSFSLESGQKFSFGTAGQGFYLEPQAQFTYGHQDSTSLTASNGLKVDLDSYRSMTGRASALFGYEMSAGDNKVNVYLKTGMVREFDGDVDYRLNGSKEKHTFKGNWWNNGVGVSAQLSKQHVLYLDLDSSTGSKFDQRQVNGGYRFSF
ncbi:autotransporter outer membrane beta-barrel domain-containing protein [Leminorella richardii]|nr:autotransporter outer membrane beta-barrel domain-containing protein [Leminorella richardii]